MITKDYKIIYATDLIGYENYASLLCDVLKITLGIRLPIYADTRKAPSENEILIGHTNRALSEKCYSGDGAKRLMTYEFIAENNNLQIACGGPHSARFAVLTLGKALADNSLDLLLNKKFDLTNECVPQTEGTDVRIMSINVLGECYIHPKHNGRHPVSAERSEILAKLLVDYTPDLIGVQEMDVKFFKPMKLYFDILKQSYGVEFSIILTHHLDKTNDCPIIYRSDKYTLDYQSFVPANYDIGEHYSTMYPCGISAAKFTSLDESKTQIAIISNHWHWEREDVVIEIPKQQIDAQDLSATTKFLENTFPGVRVFSTGDFNSHRFEEKYFKLYLDTADAEPAEVLAIQNGVLTPGLIHQGYYIDHIVGKRGTFDVLLHSRTRNHSDALTDHIPIFADIKFI